MGIAQLYQKLRYKVKCNIQEYQVKKDREVLRRQIVDYYLKNKSDDKGVEPVIEYLTYNKLTNLLMPGRKARGKNDFKTVKMAIDSDLGIPYVDHNGKKLYFQREATARTVKNHYLSLQEEQSPGSPHLYLNGDFNVKEGDVIYDVGSAEGIFALSNIDKARHVVLFEADEEWLKALHATFAPWIDKVTIVPKYVSDTDDDKNITIASFIKEYGHSLAPDFIKIDVEGAEMKVLRGIGEHVNREGLRIAVTTYHNLEDYAEISTFFAQKGCAQESSEGVTLIRLDECKAPFFRKGLIRATK